MHSICGTMHGEGGPVGHPDHNGCILPDGHPGPHEFVSCTGVHWLWTCDLSCTCEQCLEDDEHYCTTYWRKPANPLGASDV